MYDIEVESSFEQFWRYNTIIMCGGFSSAPSEEQLYVVSQKDIISEIGEPTEQKASDFKSPHLTTLSAPKADHIRTIIYIVPHTLPLGREVESCPPFDVDIKISKNKEVIYQVTHKVNQWGGASIEIKL